MMRGTTRARSETLLSQLAGRLSVRNLRLASGLILFTYIAVHLSNHALGLDLARDRRSRHGGGGRGLVQLAGHAAAVRRGGDPLPGRALGGVRTTHVPPAAGRAPAHRPRLHAADPPDRPRHVHSARLRPVRSVVGLHPRGRRSLGNGFAGAATGPAGAGMAARLPRLAFRLQPATALSAAAIRAVRCCAAAAGALGARLHRHGTGARDQSDGRPRWRKPI